MMRSEEQLKEILIRSERLKKKRRDLRKSLLYISGIVSCTALIILTAVFVPSVKDSTVGAGDLRYGGLILSAGHMSYVIIGLLAFILGVLVTLLCYHLREATKNKNNGK